MFRYHLPKNLPEESNNYFVTANQIHQHNTRKSSKHYKRYKRTNFVKQTRSQN